MLLLICLGGRQEWCHPPGATLVAFRPLLNLGFGVAVVVQQHGQHAKLIQTLKRPALIYAFLLAVLVPFDGGFDGIVSSSSWRILSWFGNQSEGWSGIPEVGQQEL